MKPPASPQKKSYANILQNKRIKKKTSYEMPDSNELKRQLQKDFSFDLETKKLN